MLPTVRENAGLHVYDGLVQDLSPSGVRAGLARVGTGRPDGGPAGHDDAHLRAFEDLLRTSFLELEEHRANPYAHIDNLDLSVYDREYAPAPERADARRRHLLAWPEAVDGAIASLGRVPRAGGAGPGNRVRRGRRRRGPGAARPRTIRRPPARRGRPGRPRPRHRGPVPRASPERRRGNGRRPGGPGGDGRHRARPAA